MRSPIYAAAVAAFVFVLFLGGAVALAPRTSASAIVDVQQSGHNVTELQNLTVYVEVAATSSVRDAYFTFCQLQAPDVCFQPITMVAHNATWFVGETKQMSTYYEMVVGMQCGYNVTVDYKNGTNVTEPSGPNSFPGLTVIKTVAGYYDYEMTVVTPTYGLSGVISDSKTGTGIDRGSRDVDTQEQHGGYDHHEFDRRLRICRAAERDLLSLGHGKWLPIRQSDGQDRGCEPRHEHHDVQ